jgi:hypothetical protein
LITQFYNSGRIISADCHVVSGLFGVTLQNGSSLIANKKTADYSCIEEILARSEYWVPFNL